MVNKKSKNIWEKDLKQKTGNAPTANRKYKDTIFRTISGNPRQFNYRDESAGVCMSAH